MEKIMDIIDFLSNNEKWLSLIVNVLLGISTFILTIVNLNFVRRQNMISKEQSKLQKDKDQPHFRISLTSEQDADDGKYGTDVLSVINVGKHTLEPCEVNADVFIRLIRSKGVERDTIYAHIGDYFAWAYRGNTGDEEVYYSKSPGGNRKYSEIYLGAINDKGERSNMVYYFIIG